MKKNRCKPNIFSFLLNGTISCDRIVPLVDKERTYELEEKYPDKTPKEREYLAAKEHGAIFLMKIGDKLASGEPHDGRAPDYDDWSLSGDGADTVTVKVDGKVTGTYPLAKDQKIRINGGTNILTIKNGKAKMTDADCPDQLCVHQKAASKNHESIICLPNKVVVEVDGSEESEFDAVAN